MEQIKSVSFREAILIPAKEVFQGKLPLSHYVGNITGVNGESTTTVSIILFNCEYSEEIPKVIENELGILRNLLKENPTKSALIHPQIISFENLQNWLDDNWHQASEELIKAISLKMRNIHAKADNVIFLSGVTSISA